MQIIDLATIHLAPSASAAGVIDLSAVDFAGKYDFNMDFNADFLAIRGNN